MPHGVLCRSHSYLLPRHTLSISTAAQFEILLAIINNKLLATRGLEPETTCRCPILVVPSFLLVVLRVSDLCRPTSFNGICYCEKFFNKNVPFRKRFTPLWPIGQLWFAVNLFTLEKLIKNSKSIDSQTH